MKRKFELAYPDSGTPSQRPRKLQAKNIFIPQEKTPEFKGNLESRNNKLRGKYDIFTYNSLPELIQEAIQSSTKNSITLRFLLTPKFELLFAKEGPPNSTIPAHFAMTGETQNDALCITAGNIKIANGDIIFISNKSGDFRPSFDSLQYAVFALIACGARFSEILTIEKHDKTIEKSLINLKKLQNKVCAAFPKTAKEQYQLANSNLAKRTHEYPKNTAGNTLFFSNVSEPARPKNRPLSQKIRKFDAVLKFDAVDDVTDNHFKPFS